MKYKVGYFKSPVKLNKMKYHSQEKKERDTRHTYLKLMTSGGWEKTQSVEHFLNKDEKFFWLPSEKLVWCCEYEFTECRGLSLGS